VSSCVHINFIGVRNKKRDSASCYPRIANNHKVTIRRYLLRQKFYRYFIHKLAPFLQSLFMLLLLFSLLSIKCYILWYFKTVTYPDQNIITIIFQAHNEQIQQTTISQVIKYFSHLFYHLLEWNVRFIVQTKNKNLLNKILLFDLSLSDYLSSNI